MAMPQSTTTYPTRNGSSGPELLLIASSSLARSVRWPGLLLRHGWKLCSPLAPAYFQIFSTLRKVNRNLVPLYC